MNIPLSIVIVYMILLLFVSWLATKRSKKAESQSYLLAGRQLPWTLVAVMIAGTFVGGTATVGVAENAYKVGIASGLYNVFWAVAVLFFGLCLSSKIRRTTTATINQLLCRVYGESVGFFSVIINVFLTFAVGALQIVAGGAILTSLLPDIFSMFSGMLVSVIIFVLITLIGGLWAASLSNIINIIIIYAGLIIGAIVAVKTYGGLDPINMTLPAGDHWYSITKGLAPAVLVAWFVSIFANGIPNPAIITTAVSAKDEKNVRKGFLFAALLIFPIGIVVSLYGIIAASQFPGLEHASLALPTVVLSLNPWIAGFVLAGLWAADVSSATGIYIAEGLMVTKDIIVKYIKPDLSEKAQILVSRIVILFTAALGFIIALRVNGILFFMIRLFTFTVPFGVIILITFFAPKLARKSTALCILVFGILATILCNFIAPGLALFGQSTYTVVIASIIGWIVSIILDKRKIDTSVLYKENYQ